MNSNSESRLAVRHTGMMRIIQIAQICILLLIINHTMSVASTTVDKSVKSVPSSKSVIQTTNGQGVYKNGISKLQQQLNQLQEYVNNKKVVNQKVLLNDEVLVYPNPADKYINIVCQNARQVVITDVLGELKLIRNLDESKYENRIEIGALPLGVYFYKILRKDGEIYIGKILIE